MAPSFLIAPCSRCGADKGEPCIIEEGYGFPNHMMRVKAYWYEYTARTYDCPWCVLSSNEPGDCGVCGEQRRVVRKQVKW